MHLYLLQTCLSTYPTYSIIITGLIDILSMIESNKLEEKNNDHGYKIEDMVSVLFSFQYDGHYSK